MKNGQLQQRLVWAALALLLSMPAVSAQTQSFPASQGGTLKLDLESGGSVTVETGGSSSIQVTVENSEESTPRCRINIEPTEGGLRVHTYFEEDDRSQTSHLKIHAVVPSRYNIEVDSMGGGLSVTGLEGTIRGRTMGGELNLSNLTGELELVTMGGNITLTDSDVDGEVSTMGGTVLRDSVTGDVQGKSMGGNVTYRNVVNTANPEDSVGDEVFIDSMGGAIDVKDAPNGARVKTMGGDVNIESAAEFVDATTMGGSIGIGEVNGSVKAVTMAGEVDVKVIGAGGTVDLSSNSGDIILHLPAGFSARFEIELAYTRNSTRNYRIDSDFAMQTEDSPDWDYSRGTARRYIYGNGTVAGGEHLVKIKTINGNVTIKSH